MFLFNKRTRNIIKYAWGFFATLIILTMVIAYSGFGQLAQTPSEQIEIPEEVRAQLELQKSGVTGGDTKVSTPEEQAILDAINEGRINIDPENTQGDPASEPASEPTSDSAPETPQAPTEELRLEI